MMGLGEYAALHLMTWSNVWWAPTSNPTPLQTRVRAAIVDGAPSDPEFSLADYSRATRATRQLLANIPTYMMYDDHDVANNWPLYTAYEKTRQNKVGRWIVGNAMLAIWFFQLCGSDPEESQWRTDRFLSEYQTYKRGVLAWMERMLRSVREGFSLMVRQVSDVARAAQRRDAEAVENEITEVMKLSEAYSSELFEEKGFSFVAPTWPPVVFMDTHSQRVLNWEATGNPSLHRDDSMEMLSESAASQLGEMVQQLFQDSPTQPLLIVSPTPLLWWGGHNESTAATSLVGSYFRKDKDWWFDSRQSVSRLLQILFDRYCQRRKTSLTRANAHVVVFSGDYHWGYQSIAKREDSQLAIPSAIVQLVSSAVKNASEPSDVKAIRFSGDQANWWFPDGVGVADGPFLTTSNRHYRVEQSSAIVENHCAYARIYWSHAATVLGGVAGAATNLRVEQWFFDSGGRSAGYFGNETSDPSG